MSRSLLNPVSRVVLLIAVFSTAFCGTCWSIRRGLPMAPVPAVEPKLRYLREHINDYDTLFVGSSRMYHQIMPSLFDELTAKGGVPTRSFNAGIDGMRPPEDAYVFDQILAMKPRNLRYVFVESAGLRTAVDEDKKDTIRSVYWHDWDRLTLLFRRALFQKKKRDFGDSLRELREPLGDFMSHVELFAKNVTNAGRSEVLTQYLRSNRRSMDLTETVGDKLDGYVKANFPEIMPAKVREAYEAELGERRKKPALEDPGDPVSQDALRLFIKKVRALGAMPVLVVPPTTNKKNFLPPPELRRDLLILNYSDINKYGALYENRNRQDTDHVNVAGAIVYTQTMAADFASAVSQK